MNAGALHQPDFFDTHETDEALVIRIVSSKVDDEDFDVLADQVSQTLRWGSCRVIVFNLVRVAYLHSRALGRLLELDQRVRAEHGHLRLSNLQPVVQELLVQTHLENYLEVFPDEISAVAGNRMRNDEVSGSTLVVRSGALWQNATHGPLLDEVCRGSLSRSDFRRWLVQDYLLTRQVIQFSSSLLAKTSWPLPDLLFASVKHEMEKLDWIESFFRERGLSLPVNRKVAWPGVLSLLDVGSSDSLEIQLVRLFAAKASFLYAWLSVRPVGPWAEYVRQATRSPRIDDVQKIFHTVQTSGGDEHQRAFDEVLLAMPPLWDLPEQPTA